MKKSASCAVVGLATIAIGVAAARVQAPEPRMLDAKWTKAYARLTRSQWPPLSVALSPSGRCVAIAAGGAVEVLDSAGETVWRWDYARANRYIVPAAIAVSPGCDAVVLVGSPGYRYTWIVDRAGARSLVPTANTALAAAFDGTGKEVAVATGGGDVLLLTRSGALKWKRKVHSGMPIAGLSFSANNDAILLHDLYLAGALRTDGSVIWSRFAGGMNASRDLRTFVTWEEPPHGPGIGSTVVLDAAGQQLWRRFTSSTGAVISSSGDTIVARINDNQEPAEEDGFHAEEQKASLQVLGRDGTVVRRLEGIDGVPMAISPDGRRVLLRVRLPERCRLEEIDLDGNRLRAIALSSYDDTVVVARDFSAVVVVNANSKADVRWYALE